MYLFQRWARASFATLPVALLLSSCGKPAQPPAMPPPNVGYVLLQSRPVTLTTELPGRIAAAETSEVRPQVSGVIKRRLFTEGAQVRAGQLLYEIEDAPFRASVVTAQGNLANAEAQIRSTRLQADRYRQLVAINAVSRQEADNAIASADQARASVVAQRGALQTARVNLGFSRIRAPISGRIGRSVYTVGALVQAGQADALTTIQRMDRVFVDVTQSATDLLNLRAALSNGAVTRGGPGSARVQLILPNGATYPIEGTLQFADVTVDPTSGSVTVRASFPNPDGTLLPGMYVRAKLVEGTRQQALVVPQTGISRNERGDGTALVLDANNVVAQRIVKTDRAIGNDWVVSSGLKPGDKLIVEGLLNLRPGTKVQAHPAGAAPPPPGAKPAQPAMGG
jgi:membrane fusion protein (multidrug efflux system)